MAMCNRKLFIKMQRFLLLEEIWNISRLRMQQIKTFLGYSLLLFYDLSSLTGSIVSNFCISSFLVKHASLNIATTTNISNILVYSLPCNLVFLLYGSISFVVTNYEIISSFTNNPITLIMQWILFKESSNMASTACFLAIK